MTTLANATNGTVTPAASAEAATLLASAPAENKTGAEADAAAAAAAAAAAEGAKPKVEGDKPKEGDKPEGAPEKYEFTAPEGLDLDPELMPELEAFARENNLPNATAQKLVDLGAKIVQKQLAVLEQISTKWAEDAANDKEFGGDALKENLAIGKLALDKWGTPELRRDLNDTKFGNNPELIRFCIRAGKTLKPDTSPNTTSPAAQAKSAADTLYGG